jgi:MFS family permease
MTRLPNTLIITASFLCTFVWAGCGFYAFSLFVKPLQDAFGWERGSIMAAFTVTFLAYGLTSPLVGTAIHRWGDRKVVIISAIIFGAGLLGLSTVNSLPLYYLYSGIMGLGMAGIGPMPASNIITHHFHEKRGVAIGIMSAGVGLGGLVLSPLISSLLIPSFGWRFVYIILAVFSWVILIPVSALALKPVTAAAGHVQDSGLTATHHGHYGLTLKQALGTRAFWLIIVVVFFSQLSQVGAIQNQVPYMSDLGFPVALASLCLGLIGLCSAIGKYLFGWVCDHIRANHASLIGIALQAAGIIILLNLASSSPDALAIAYSLVLGLGTGAWLPTLSMMVSENLGIKEYSRIFGAATLSYAVGTAIGPLFTSLVFQYTGDYRIAFICLLALYALAAPAALMIKQAYSREKQALNGQVIT